MKETPAVPQPRSLGGSGAAVPPEPSFVVREVDARVQATQTSAVSVLEVEGRGIPSLRVKCADCLLNGVLPPKRGRRARAKGHNRHRCAQRALVLAGGQARAGGKAAREDAKRVRHPNKTQLTDEK